MKTPPYLMPALVTPFTGNGDIDNDAHRHNLSRLSEYGIQGFLLAGSTGEGPLLEPGERRLLTATARESLGRRPHLMVGVAAESVRQAMAQVTEAGEAGADSVLVTTPTTLARRSLDAQRRYYLAVAQASPLPMLLYSVPPNTGYALDEGLAVELAGHPNIVGMKDSGGDAVRIQRIVAGAPEDFLMFNGASASIALAVMGGAHGAITASTNYMPGLVSKLVDRARRAPSTSGVYQMEVTRISRAVEQHGVPGVKAAAESIGLLPGRPRPPLAPLTKRQIAALPQLERI